MYLAGYTTITNVDYSSVCMESMAQRHTDCTGMSWVCMDARRLAFPDSSFDVVMEKGMLDAMLVEERDPWNVSDASAQLLDKILKEVIASAISVGTGIYCYFISLPHTHHIFLFTYFMIPSALLEKLTP